MDLQGHFQQAGESRYTMSLLKGAIVFDLDRLRRDRSELVGELMVKCTLGGARTVDGVLALSDFNLSSQQARVTRAKYLAERAQTKAAELDWTGLVEEFAQRVLTFERRGSEAIRLCDVPAEEPSTQFDVAGLGLLERHPIILFGESGHGKSLLALYLAGCLARQGGRILYADWEFDAIAHRERLAGLFGVAEMPRDIWYARCDRPLVFEVERLRRLVLQHQAHYLICDSIVFACQGPPENAEVASSYFQALRQIGLGSLNIGHITKGSADKAEQQRQTQKPFGSNFWHGGARATWFLKQADETAHGFQIGLYPRKHSTQAKGPAIGFSVRYGESRQIEIRPADIRDTAELAAGLPVWQRIKTALSRGARSMAALADELDVPVNTIQRTVRRYEGRTFVKVLGADGIAKIGLAQGVR